MKTLILAAIAAMGVATVASANDFDANMLTTTVETGALEFSASTTVDSDLNGFGDDFVLGVKGTVLSYELGTGTSDFNIYGQYGQVASEDFGVLGAEYVWTTAIADNATLELTGDVAYVMFDGLDNGDLVLTPSAELTVGLTRQIAVFGGAGYGWEATDDFARLGGYSEVGLDLGFTDTVSLRPSVVQPFDTGNDDLVGALELNLKF